MIKNTGQKFNPEYPFEYHFLNEQYEHLYNSEKGMAEIFGYFTFFTLFIACLRLIGLINRMIEKKRKQISIRKVLGASISSILVLLSKEYVQLILIAFVISIPIANYFTLIGWKTLLTALKSNGGCILCQKHWYCSSFIICQRYE